MQGIIKMLTVVSLIAGVPFLLNAQQEVAIGQWKAHFPFNSGKDVAVANGNVYYASDLGILKLPEENQFDFQFFTTVDGLSDAEPRIIRYHEEMEVLIVVYSNTNIDLIFEDEIINFPEIMNSTLVSGDRRINQVSFDNQNRIYFNSNFGLVQFDLETLSFGFSLITNTDVFDLTEFQGHFYMSTENGLFRAPTSGFNHQDFTRWVRIGEANGLPESEFYSGGSAAFEGKLYIATGEDVFASEGDDFYPIMSESGFRPKFLRTSGVYLAIGWECLSGCSRDRGVLLDRDGQIMEISTNCFNQITNIEVGPNGRAYIGDEFRGIRFSRPPYDNCDQYYPNSPFSSNVTDMDVRDDVLYVASGGVTDIFLYRFRTDGYFIYKDGRWSAYNPSNTPEFSDPTMFDFYQIITHPSNEKFYIGTFWRGLIEVDGDDIKIYDSSNSCLQMFVPENLRERISGMQFDQLNRLWVTNDGAPEPIVMFDSEMNCHSFNVPNFKFLTDLDIDRNGYKWIAVRDGGAGLVVFDEGQLSDPSDERLKILTSGNSNLPNNQVLSVTTDLNGSVWVGTTDGVVVFDCTSAVFDGNCPGSRRRVEVDGFLAELLTGERVQAIAVDGANRKWFGTTNGLFLQSPNGDEQIAYFNTSNSPLIDNNIVSLAINEKSGEVYIGTSKGIMSYRSDATAGGRTHESSVTVFPNPVRPEYEGPIAIRGLARDARVKITDVRGNLVYETVANGGQAIWNGRDLEGRKTTSGVYMIFATTRASGLDSPEGKVGKIMVVR
ncbi:MAG: hypothetical protein EA411_08035 [Saprospirales bacterium]|nr:MAG: hypothetical protein EA411_08035 [Saprospirales bacterium]